MNWNMKNLLMTGLVASALVLSNLPAKAETYGVVLPLITSKNEQVIIKNALNEIIVKRAKPNDKIIIHDGVGNRLIAIAELPDRKVLRFPKLRMKYARQAFAKVVSFMGMPDYPSDHAQPYQIFSTLADEVRNLYPKEKLYVLYMGSLLAHDERAADMSMLNGYYPSDAHLKVDGFVSPYGIADRPNAQNNTTYHICNTDDRFTSREHYKAVHRFWSLSVSGQGGKLATFTNDMGICLARFLKNSQPAVSFTPHPSETKPEMLQVKAPKVTVKKTSQVRTTRREMPQAQLTKRQGARFLATDVPIETGAASKTIGLAKLGIRWDKEIDLDIHVIAYPGAKSLSYKNSKIDEGRFDKDWRGSPNDQHAYEYVEFNTTLDLKKMKVFVNFFGGRVVGGARGVLRIWLENQGVWEKSFVIPASRGNQGKNSKQHWVSISPKEVLRLANIGR